MIDVPEGSVWRLKSGRLVEVERANSRGQRVDCFYVSELGRPLAPPHRNTVSLSREFIEVYARRWHFDRVGVLDNTG